MVDYKIRPTTRIAINIDGYDYLGNNFKLLPIPKNYILSTYGLIVARKSNWLLTNFKFFVLAAIT